jgi:hypothetical protein
MIFIVSIRGLDIQGRLRFENSPQAFSNYIFKGFGIEELKEGVIRSNFVLFI